MKRWLPLAVLAAITLLTSLVTVYDRTLLHFLGWDGQTSDNYAAWSGSVPAIVAILGYSGVLAGLWHRVNCHEAHCLRVGRHMVDGTPWCNQHHHHAREHRETTLGDVVERLDKLLLLLEGQQ